jgi:hypothetical protein
VGARPCVRGHHSCQPGSHACSDEHRDDTTVGFGTSELAHTQAGDGERESGERSRGGETQNNRIERHKHDCVMAGIRIPPWGVSPRRGGATPENGELDTERPAVLLHSFKHPAKGWCMSHTMTTFNPNTIDARTRTLDTRTMITHEWACDGVCRKGEGAEGLLTEGRCVGLCLTLPARENIRTYH